MMTMGPDSEDASDGARSEVKAKIPKEYRLRLHTTKILTGKDISDQITDALEAHFAERDDAAADATAPAAPDAEAEASAE